MRNLFLSILFLLSTGLNAQTINLSGIFINETTGEAIPFATIEIMGKGIGCAANYKGKFSLELPLTSLNDTVKCSSLAYASKLLAIKSFGKDYSNILIQLKPIAYTLKEIEIFEPTAGKYKLGNYEDRKKSYGGQMEQQKGQIAVYMDSKRYKKAKIINASFYISRNCGKPETPFRVRVYSVDEKTGNPGNDLIPVNIIIKGKRKGGWTTVDLSKYNIDAPSSGYFVAMEWINTGDEYYYQTYINIINKVVTNYGQVCSITKIIPFPNTWDYTYGYGWNKYTGKMKDGFYYNSMITSEIAIQQ